MKPGDRLGSYKIVAELGAGGMGEVYRATDSRLGRDVALKVLPPGVASEPDRLARFQREARAVAALNHPNVVTLHSVEEADGIHFLTMELVEGQPLDQLVREGDLAVARILEIGTAVASALIAAHQKGILHRDLKPANVMVCADGRTKVLDFGLAKEMRPANPGDATVTSDAQTEAGAVLGTPAYMSPEQVAGRAVDHRTDLFSLGVMLYEMATRRRPFTGDSSAEVMSAVLRDEPPAARSSRVDLPSDLDALITHCLRKERSDRPQSAQDVHAALAAASTTKAAAGADDEQSIAVLPFASLSQDPEDEFFADGVTEEILNALTQVPGLRVAGRSSAFSFKGRHEDLRTVGASLNVATILEGTMRRAGNRLRITAQLVNAVDGYQIWSERFDGVMEDVFAVQDEIAGRITERLRLSLGETPGRPGAEPPTRHLEAYALYLKGRALLYRRGLAIPRAIECFKEAVALDPGYAQAWAGLADGYTTSGYSGGAPGRSVMPDALRAARKALELVPDLAEAHAALACATLLYERDYALAEREFQRAIELNPHYPQARAWYGLFYLQWASGRRDEAEEQLLELLRLDPRSAYAHGMVAFYYFGTGRPDEAVTHARRATVLDPESYHALWSLVLSYYFGSRFEEAVQAAEQALAMSGRHSWTLTTLVQLFASWGKPDQALAMYREVQGRAETEYVQPSMLATAAAAVGDDDRAIALLQQAYSERDPLLVLLPGSGIYRPLDDNPRAQAILDRLKLPAIRAAE